MAKRNDVYAIRHSNAAGFARAVASRLDKGYVLKSSGVEMVDEFAQFWAIMTKRVRT